MCISSCLAAFKTQVLLFLAGTSGLTVKIIDALHTNQDKGCWFTDDTTWIQCTDLFWKGDKSFHRASVKEIQGYFK